MIKLKTEKLKYDLHNPLSSRDTDYAQSDNWNEKYYPNILKHSGHSEEINMEHNYSSI